MSTKAETVVASPRADAPGWVSGSLSDRFRAMRSLTEALAAPLSDADATLQSMEDASPTKWHLAHTTWFWETFLLRDNTSDHHAYHEDWAFLFNSYYEAEGERIDRFARGMLSRPTLDEILAYRRHGTDAMGELCDREELAPLIELGIAHEQQHQELLLTDIKHALFQNPLGPAMWDRSEAAKAQPGEPKSRGWYEHLGGIALLGHDGDGFAYDNEGPRHRTILEPFALSKTLVTNGEWAEFIADGGYESVGLWLSDGWAWVKEYGIEAPLYWRDDEQFTLAGWEARDPAAPVTHISYFEADAFATWAGHRLPSEAEWEAIARGQRPEEERLAHDPMAGNQLDVPASDPSWQIPHPRVEAQGDGLFGNCWQFTGSAYLPYPRFRIADGAIGEYNGKFMSGQNVLRGASCATARGHSRPSYRNFFYPHQRWQFTGLRLAKDL
ncbi:ergothioneine biosynthesis protein EgtB [Altererythrobacter aurantiacus]|uniref:Ergothioneine biosynthesis protein EgtB n=1 Tax=Parapontixanthobacter aurantiacus TaxID=1463599 RepID=A0A844ZCQ4_9SPHN|nr:ergothioneine biosynthesis protein EgtB [Parapontixanthobacter aurantiacus]MXO85665.1 ergothioneine biosynthesis protein EgtB [Parapontixanthobacter aurantiacus]